MLRRRFMAVLAGLLASSATGRGVPRRPKAQKPRPGDANWPGADAWSALKRQVEGRLEAVTVPVLDAATAPSLLANPFYLGSQAGLTQSSGWLDAWRSAPSAYVVRAKTAADVAAAVQFAATTGVRLVVKGGGHSYLGGSNAPDSLLVWTRDMDAVTLHDDFVPLGSKDPPVKAVSVGAGCLWGRVYAEVTGRGGRYVQGGGCTTVGVAGLVQGGGFGSFSKSFGLAAASLLEAEIVTADGQIRTVNASRDPDLFWALKGGGGGTFGVITRVTLRTHDLPENFGVVFWEVKATSDDAYRRLLARFIDTYAETLFEPRWGEQVRATHDNRLAVQMLFHSLDEAGAKAAWASLTSFVAAHPGDYTIVQPLLVAVIPARRFWDAGFLHEHMPQALTLDSRPEARAGDYWWTGNTGEAGTFWHGYHSLWLPKSLLEVGNRAKLVDAWFDASRHWSVSFHFNKGLAGASANALAASADTAMNPEVLAAFALAIIADDGPSAYAGLPAPDLVAARDDARGMSAAIAELRTAAPTGGSYLSECDYFLANWEQACWGSHATRLAGVKRRYDPNHLFRVHHGIGSES